MTQNEFAQNLALSMEIPNLTVKKLISSLIIVVRQSLSMGDEVELPRWGKWFTTVRQGKNIYNPYYETVVHYSAGIIVRFLQFFWSAQNVQPGYKPYVTSTGVRVYPQCVVAERVSLNSNIDLLICNQFIYMLVDQLIDLMTAGETISFDNLGSFKIYENARRNGRNPRTGATILIKARKKVRFNASARLKELVN